MAVVVHPHYSNINHYRLPRSVLAEVIIIDVIPYSVSLTIRGTQMKVTPSHR